MRYFFLLSLFLLLTNCNKPKTVLICGDHVCVNKSEAIQFFEQNLSIEVKIIDKKIKNEINLVELNLNQNTNGIRKISVSSREKSKKKLRTLSNTEVSKIKKNIKNKKKEENILSKKIVNKNFKKSPNSNNDKKILRKKNNETIQNINKERFDVVDVCTILEKCSIDEISKYLLEQGKKKKFPDITIRQ